jgi:hypothetical protein
MSVETTFSSTYLPMAASSRQHDVTQCLEQVNQLVISGNMSAQHNHLVQYDIDTCKRMPEGNAANWPHKQTQGTTQLWDLAPEMGTQRMNELCNSTHARAHDQRSHTIKLTRSH